MQTLDERLEGTLAALPPDADEIAALFSNEGITGRRDNPCDCPVANYLSSEGVVAPSVGITHASGFSRAFEQYATVDVPSHVRQFIAAFDSGRYPELITPVGA